MTSDRKKVVIIGAGVAGMSASVDLSRMGHSVVVLEGRKFAGGRTYSFADETSGDIIDNGQHAMVGAYTEYFGLLSALGTLNLLDSDESLTLPIFDISGANDVLVTHSALPKFGILKGLLKLKLISFRSKLSLLKLLFKIKFNSCVDTGLSVKEYLNDNHQGKDAVYYFWEPLTYAVLNCRTDVAPASLLITVLKKSFLSDSQNAKFYLPSAGLSELTNGFAEKIRNYGNEIHFSAPVKAITFAGNYATEIVTEKKIYKDFDFVVSTLPPNVLSKVLPVDVMNNDFFSKIKTIKNSPITSIYLWTDYPIMQYKFAALTGTKTQWIFNKNVLAVNRRKNPDFPYLYSLTISASDDITNLPAEEIATQCFAEVIACMKPEIVPRLLHYRVFKDKSATMLSTVESLNYKPNAVSPVKNFLLAGDWTNTGLPPTIESAALSGKICANFINNQ